MEKNNLLYTVGGNVNWYSYYGKQYMEIPQKIKNRTKTQSTSENISTGNETLCR